MLLGPDGRPWTGADVRVEVANFEGQVPLPELGADGSAVLHAVLCGREYQVSVFLGTQIETRVEGPGLQGERVCAELRMEQDLPIIAGRILDGDRQPVSGSFFLQFNYGSGMTSATLETDETGRFRAPLDARMTGQSVNLKASHSRNGIPQAGPTAVVDVGGPLQAGVNDVGDLVLPPHAA